MIRKWVGRIFVWGLIAIAVGVMALGGYFYYKAGQPMQVAAAQRITPGITYREFLTERIQRWKEIDDQQVAKGKGKACVSVPVLMLPMMYTGSVYEVNFLRSHRGTKEAAAFLRRISNIMPPEKLTYGPWWKLPDAWWWQIENMSWWAYYRPQARAWNCEVGAPRNSVQK